MHYLGQNSSAPGRELWLLKELNHQRSQTPETGWAESHPGSQLAQAGRGAFIPPTWPSASSKPN